MPMDIEWAKDGDTGDLFTDHGGRTCHAAIVSRELGICGQAPSDFPQFAALLVREGINSISLNPDSVVKVLRHVAETERSMDAESSAAGGGGA